MDNLFNFYILLNCVLFICWNRYDSIDNFSDDLVFSSNQASIIVQSNNSVNFNRNVILNVNSLLLSDFNYNFNGLFNKSINNNWLDERLLSRKYNWNFNFFFNRSEFLIYNYFSFSVDFWLRNSNWLSDNFFNLDNVSLNSLFSNWNLDWNVDFFMLNESRSNLDCLLDVSVHNFRYFHNN